MNCKTATKIDLKHLEVKLGRRIGKVEEGVDKLEGEMNQRFDYQEKWMDLKFQEMEGKLDEKAAERHNELMNLFDGLAKEIRDNREFRTIVGHQISRLDEAVFGSQRTV